MQIAHEPSPGYLAHDVFDRIKCGLVPGFVVHRQYVAGCELQYEEQEREHAEVVPDIEVFRGIVPCQLALDEFPKRQTRFEPGQQSAPLTGIMRRDTIVLLLDVE